MADLCSNFLDSPSFNSFSLLIPRPPPPKSSPFSALPIHPPSHPNRRRRRRKPPLLTMLKPSSSAHSSPDFDVVSIAECSDGSMVFRFGDLNEVPRTIEVEESNFAIGLLVSGSTENPNVVKVLDGEHERQVIIKEIEREVRSDSTTEVADIVKNIDTGACSKENDVNESQSIVVMDLIDSEAELNDILLEDPQEIEVPISEEVPIDENDCSCSEAPHVSHINENESSRSGLLAMGKSVHSLKGSVEKERQEISGPVGAAHLDQSSGSVSEVLEETIEVETVPSSTTFEHCSVLEVDSSFASEGSNERNIEVNHHPANAENHTVEAEMGNESDKVVHEGIVVRTMHIPILDVETSHDVSSEFDTQRNESSKKRQILY